MAKHLVLECYTILLSFKVIARRKTRIRKTYSKNPDTFNKVNKLSIYKLKIGDATAPWPTPFLTENIS